jgi:NADH dehydrogenase
MGDKKSRVLILGGGFSGLYTALEFERRKDPDIEVTLVNRDNFFLFTPMLHEIAASDLDMTNIVNPVRKMLRHVDFFAGDVESIDLEERAVLVSHGFDHHTHTLEYDHLVLALGSITNFFKLPGLDERALTMKSLGDAIQLRNRLIAHLEEADTECAAKDREALLTFVVAGGGFAGVETIASINDFLHDVLPFYPNLKPEMLRVVLVHPGEYILPELGESLGRYADQKLRERGVEIHRKTRVSGVTQREVQLNDGTQLTSFTLIWTAGASPNPTIDLLDCPKERGRLKVNEFLSVGNWPGIWAVGDCALVPDLTTGEFCPPTAQHAVREGRVLAHNIRAEIRGTAKKPFKFRTLGQLASIGRRTGVAQILGVKFSGFLAWFLWRGIYWSKLPRMEKKVRVAIDWLLDVLFTKDFTQFIAQRAPVISMPAAAINLSSSATAPLKRQAKRGGVEPIRHETAPVNDMHKTQILYPVRQALSNDLGIKTGPRRLY